MSNRIVFKLSSEERYRFRRLKSAVGQAFKFWDDVAKARKLDPKTIFYVDGEYSGLPIGHKKWWCYPIPLKCTVDPATVEI